MYRSIETGIWDDPRVRNLDTCARLLFLYLVTNRHTHFSGIYSLRPEYVALETGLSAKQVEGGFAALKAESLAKYDVTLCVVWVVRMFQHQGRGTKVVAGAATHLATLHRSPLVTEFLDTYPQVRACRTEDDWTASVLPSTRDTPLIPHRRGIDAPSILPVTDPAPVPESGVGESEGRGRLTQDGVAKALKRRLGSSINPCRDQVRALVAAGWALGAIAVAVEEHGEPGLAPWDWTKRARGVSGAPAHRSTPNAREILAAARRQGGAAPDDPLTLPETTQ